MFILIAYTIILWNNLDTLKVCTYYAARITELFQNRKINKVQVKSVDRNPTRM